PRKASQALPLFIDLVTTGVRGPVDPDLAQKGETDLNGALEMTPGGVELRSKSGDIGARLNVRTALREDQQLRLRDVQMPDQEFALGVKRCDRERGPAAARMGVFSEQPARDLKVSYSGMVGGRIPCALAGSEVDGNDLFSFGLYCRGGDAAVQLVGN